MINEMINEEAAVVVALSQKCATVFAIIKENQIKWHLYRTDFIQFPSSKRKLLHILVNNRVTGKKDKGQRTSMQSIRQCESNNKDNCDNNSCSKLAPRATQHIRDGNRGNCW